MADPAASNDSGSGAMPPRGLVVVSAGTSEPSSTRLLADRITQFAGNATRAEQAETDIDFDSPLMRLAAGGSTRPERIGPERTPTRP